MIKFLGCYIAQILPTNSQIQVHYLIWDLEIQSNNWEPCLDWREKMVLLNRAHILQLAYNKDFGSYSLPTFGKTPKHLPEATVMKLFKLPNKLLKITKNKGDWFLGWLISDYGLIVVEGYQRFIEFW